MATARIEVPHVYTGLAEILKHLSVEKTGTLPGNMGGKPYITAVDAAAEVKRQFVENNLVFVPNEEVVKHENIVTADRAVKISIVIRGEYTIVSTVDGSSVTVSGVGDGLANGTAVASNIGSTNALKNALLRTFLITEQSVEDAGKDGPAEGKPSAASKPLEKARTAGQAKAPASDSKSKVRDWIGNDDERRSTANKKMDELKQAGLSGTALYDKLAEAVGA